MRPSCMWRRELCCVALPSYLHDGLPSVSGVALRGTGELRCIGIGDELHHVFRVMLYCIAVAARISLQLATGCRFCELRCALHCVVPASYLAIVVVSQTGKVAG